MALSRDIARWTPWDIEDLFDDFFTRGMTRHPWRRTLWEGYPAVNVYANEEKAVLTAEVPGVNPQDIDVSVRETTLTITGKRDLEEPKEQQRFIRRERERGEFSRSLTLPFSVERDQVTAECRNGVLILHLPRKEADKPRKIQVTPE